MADNETIYNFFDESPSYLNGSILECEAEKDAYPNWNTVSPSSLEENQEVLLNAASNRPQAVIVNPKEPAHYKTYSGPNGDYLWSRRCVPVRVEINYLRPGLELSVMARYKALIHQHKVVKICHMHFNSTLADSNGIDLKTDNCAVFLLIADCSRKVQHELEDGHPIARLTLNAAAKSDKVDLVFPCLSSCASHNKDNLMLMHLDIRDIKSREVVWSYSFTVRVAANAKSFADAYYRQDMLGGSSPYKSPGQKRNHENYKEELSDASISCKKALKVDLEGEPNDESTIVKGMAIALNGASSSASGGSLTSSSSRQETPDSIQLSSSNGAIEGATTANEHGFQQSELKANTSERMVTTQTHSLQNGLLHMSNEALPLPTFGATSVASLPPAQENPSLLHETTPENNSLGNAPLKVGKCLMVQVSDENKASLIRQIVALAGGSCVEIELVK